ncbi:MAG TPA: radical SAM protein [Dissulfurispiraceae bacterium]|nr:radical SAM protein [Dissulfurispiraceae bacterium]
MDVLLVNTNRCDQPFPVMPLGACMVADALSQHGHRTRMLDLMFDPDPIASLRRALKSGSFDIVGFSLRNIDNNDMRQPQFFLDGLPAMVDAVREISDAKIVIGGAAVGVMPDDILRFSGADYAVVGDGEIAAPELLSLIEGNNFAIADRLFRAGPKPSLAPARHCAPPDLRRWIDVSSYLARMSTVPLQTKLGCPYHCVYCTYRKIEGESYRLCPPEHVADAVQRLSSEGLRDIEFVDNVFNSPYDHAMEICLLLSKKKHGARLQSLELNPAFVDDSLIEAMEEAGFVGMGITAESASDAVLGHLRKPFTVADVHKAAAIVSRRQLPCIWIFLLGGPGENRQSVEETLSFAEEHVRPKDAVFFNIGVRIYPGTELEAIARAQKVLNTKTHEMLRPVFYVSPDIDPDWLSERMRTYIKKHMNVIDSTSLSLPFLPALHKIGRRIGFRPPLWRHTPAIRRLLQYTGIYTYR